MAAGQRPGGGSAEGAVTCSAELRELTRVVQDGDGGGMDDVAIGRQDRLAELFAALDRCMSRPGTPQAGSPGRRPRHELVSPLGQPSPRTRRRNSQRRPPPGSPADWRAAAGRVSAGYLPVIPAGLSDAEVARLYFEAMEGLESCLVAAASDEGAARGHGGRPGFRRLSRLARPARRAHARRHAPGPGGHRRRDRPSRTPCRHSRPDLPA